MASSHTCVCVCVSFSSTSLFKRWLNPAKPPSLKTVDRGTEGIFWHSFSPGSAFQLQAQCQVAGYEDGSMLVNYISLIQRRQQTKSILLYSSKIQIAPSIPSHTATALGSDVLRQIEGFSAEAQLSYLGFSPFTMNYFRVWVCCDFFFSGALFPCCVLFSPLRQTLVPSWHQ